MANTKATISITRFPCKTTVEVATADIEDVKLFHSFRDKTDKSKLLMKNGTQMRTAHTPEEVAAKVSEAGGRVRGKN